MAWVLIVPCLFGAVGNFLICVRWLSAHYIKVCNHESSQKLVSLCLQAAQQIRMTSFQFLARVVTVSFNVWVLVAFVCHVEQCRPPDLAVVTFWSSTASWILCKSDLIIPMANCMCVNGGVQLKQKVQHAGTWSATAWPPIYLCYPQQCSSVTFVALCIHSHKEKFSMRFKNVIVLILLLSLKFCKWNCVTWNCASQGVPVQHWSVRKLLIEQVFLSVT